MAQFKLLFSRKHEILELELGELVPWIEGELLRKNKPLIEKANRVRARLQARLSRLRETGDYLQAFEPKLGEMEVSYAGAIKAAKEALAAAALGEKDLGSDNLATVDDVVNLNARAKQILEHLVSVCQANRKIGYTFLKGQIKRVEKSMRTIAKETSDLDHILESRSGKAVERCLELAEELVALEDEFKLAEGSERELRRRLSQLEAESSQTAAALDGLRRSQVAEEAERLKTELATTETGIFKLVTPIVEALANLRRALNKYGYLVAHDKRKVSLLEAFNTAEALLEWGDRDSLLVLLEDLRRKVKAGELQLKNSSKVLESLDYLHAHIPPQARMYEETKRRIHEGRIKLSQSCLGEIDALEAKIREMEVIKRQLGTDVQAVIGDLRRLEARKAEKAAQVEEQINTACGVKIRLK